MEFITYSETHYRPNANKSYTRPDGFSSWFHTQLQLTSSVFEYAKTHGITIVFFDGDLFEEKNRINVQIYNAVWQLYKDHSKDFTIILNTGNHDYYAKNRDSTLKPFSDILTVVTEPYDFETGDTVIRIIPHGLLEGNLKVPDGASTSILFTHEDISELQWGTMGHRSSSPVQRQMFNDWSYVFNGHIHKPQELGNIINIGSFMVQDWGEAEEQKRFIHYKDGKIIAVPIHHPEFKTFDRLTDELCEVIENDSVDFYRIDVETQQLSNPIFKKFNVSPNIIKTEKREVRLRKTESVEEEITQYIDIMNPLLDRNKLIEVGKSLLTN